MHIYMCVRVRVCVCVCLSVCLSNLSAKRRMWHRINFKRLNSEISFSSASRLNKAKETRVHYYLIIARGRRSMPFLEA